MGVNATNNVPIFSVVKISIRLGSAPHSTALQLKNDNELSQSSKEPLSRPVIHQVRFEKGSLIDIYA
jgi:hypothetical protein